MFTLVRSYFRRSMELSRTGQCVTSGSLVCRHGSATNFSPRSKLRFISTPIHPLARTTSESWQEIKDCGLYGREAAKVFNIS